MSENEILSDEEMSDLTGNRQSQDASSQEELYEHGQVLPYDFKQPQHTKQSHFPTLQIINEKTAIDLRDRLENMLQEKTEVTAKESHINKFGEFVYSLNIPVDIKKIHVPELKGSFYVCFEDGLIDAVIEGYFGAPEMVKEAAKSNEDNENTDDTDAQIDAADKEEFTNAESRICQKLLSYVLESMQEGWRILGDYHFNFEKSENNPRLINDIDHEELIVNMNFEVKIRDKANVIRIGVPYKTLDKVKHKLRRVVQNIQEASDKRWLSKLYE